MSAERCEKTELVASYALGALPEDEALEVEAHLSGCTWCAEELDALRSVVECFAGWPADVLRPPPSLAERLANRIADETGKPPARPIARWREPAWNQVAPGIWCKLLATDESEGRVTMLVKLEPEVDYPPHTHDGVEELHLLDGELWIDERKLHPGDYNRAEPGTADRRVWSQTGCTCVLVTSLHDTLFGA